MTTGKTSITLCIVCHRWHADGDTICPGCRDEINQKGSGGTGETKPDAGAQREDGDEPGTDIVADRRDVGKTLTAQAAILAELSVTVWSAKQIRADAMAAYTEADEVYDAALNRWTEARDKLMRAAFLLAGEPR